MERRVKEMIDSMVDSYDDGEQIAEDIDDILDEYHDCIYDRIKAAYKTEFCEYDNLKCSQCTNKSCYEHIYNILYAI